MSLPTSFERGRVRPSDFLRPEYRGEVFETPVDDRGFVLQDALVALVKSLYYPEFNWQDGRRPDEHHFYWPEYLYKQPYTSPESRLPIFRDLSFHKALVPRLFHEEVEVRTIRPPVPKDKEAIHYRIESCLVAQSLFANSQGLIQTPRQARRRAELVRNNPGILKPSYNGVDFSAIEYFESTLEDYFTGFQREYDRIKAIPAEFRLIDIDDTGGSARLIATKLGKIGMAHVVKKGSLNMVPIVLAA